MTVSFFITCTIVFSLTFSPVSAITQPKTGLRQLNIPETSGSGSLNKPASTPQKGRKESISLPPPGKERQSTETGQVTSIRSVFVPEQFSYTVIQQPENNPFFVSSEKNLVTEFSLARKYNNIGLLAHNTLAGQSFRYLEVGQEIYVIHTDGQTDRYMISTIYRFQALESNKTESRFIDLDSGKTLTAREVFTRMYTGEPHLTLQTCIYAKGKSSWGRLFIIATPVIETN